MLKEAGREMLRVRYLAVPGRSPLHSPPLVERFASTFPWPFPSDFGCLGDFW